MVVEPPAPSSRITVSTMKVFGSDEVAQEVADVLRPVDPIGCFIEDSDEPVVVVMLPSDREPPARLQSAASYRLDFRTSRFRRSEIADVKRQVTSRPYGQARFACGYDVHADVIQVVGYFPDAQVAARMRSIPGVEVIAVPRDQAFRRLCSR